MWDIHWVVPSGYGIDDMLRQFGLAEPRVCSLGNVKMLEHIFRKMHDAIRADSLFGNYRASGYLYDFLIEFYRLISAEDTSLSVSPALMKAVDHINYNYASPITMDDLCGAAGVSKAAFVPAFQEHAEYASNGIHRKTSYPRSQSTAYRYRQKHRSR